MATIPTTEPTEIRAGDTISWRREDLSVDYPASLWTLTYTLINSSEKYTISATADGDNFAVTVLAATSANYTAGTYTLTGRVTKTTESYTVYSNSLTILPNLAAETTYDDRTDARKILDAIDAIILGRATASQVDLVSKTIGDKNIARNPEILLKYRDIYKKEVTAENIAAGLSGPRRIGIRLTRI